MGTLEDKYIGQKIKERRMSLGITQATLGKTDGISFQQKHKYEKGITKILASRLYRFSKVLKVDIGYFFEGIDRKINLINDNKKALKDVQELNSDVIRGQDRLNTNFAKIKDEDNRESIIVLAKFYANRNNNDRA
jgi:transcriptional regulator with XRE-family HTH domain